MKNNLRKWESQNQKWQKSRKHVEIPEWDEYFMSIAILAATRSKDAQTNYGAVIVRDRKILGTGYNSFPKDMDDNILPNTRPDKYPWMIHAEKNALYNCTVNPKGSTVYVNGQPCFMCLRDLYQNGIEDFVITSGISDMLKNYSSDELTNYKTLIRMGNISIRKIRISQETFNRAQKILQKSN